MTKEVEEVKLGDFDPLHVHYIDPKTKLMTRKNPFKLIIDSGIRFYEWPVGSSNLWWEDRKPAGRLGDDGRPVRDKAHEVWTPPVTSDQAVAIKNATLEQQNKKLQLELEAIKKEQELAASHPAPKEVSKPAAKAKAIKEEPKEDPLKI